MKTKNIFRAFLMAVILLVGGNSAKAGILYENSSGSGGYAYITLPFGAFDGFQGGKLRITYALLDGDHSIQIGNVARVSVTDSGVYEMPLDNNFYSNINTTDQYNVSTFIQPANVTIYTIEAVSAGGGADGGGSDEPATPQTYSVTVTSGIANGSITANPTSAKEGDQVTLTITPNSGYELDWVNVKDANGGDITVTDNKFDMPASNVTVSGAFKKSTVKANITSSTGYATFCSNKALDFSGVSGLKAYYAKSVSEEGMVVFEQVTGTVAAGTGLLLHGTTADIPVATGTGNAITGNLLKGTTYTTVLQGPNCYVLTVENGQVKFASTKLTAATVYEGHAYLELPTSNNQSRLMISFVGESTGIEDATLIGQEENVYYDLRGMRVEKPTHGIYIVNGKKVFVK